MKKFIVLTLLASLMPNPANAEPSILPLSLKHKLAMEVSTGIGTGNIDNQNYKVSGKLTSTKDRYTNEFKANFSGIEDRNKRKDDIYTVGDKLRYAIDDSSYAFGEAEHVNKEVSGIKARTSETVGYGRDLIQKDNFTLTGEAAGGFRQSDYRPGLNDESSMLGKLGANMDWEVYDGYNLNNNTYMGFTEDNTQTVSDTNLKKFIFDKAYVKGGVEVENNSATPPGYKKTDTVTSVGVGYEF